MTVDRPLSEHFTLYDLTRTDHKDLQEENRHLTDEETIKLVQVANLLESCREILDCELDVHSGRRYLVLNKRVGGSERSQHLKCEAADFSPKGPDTQESIMLAFEKLLKAAREDRRFAFGQLMMESDGRGREGRKVWIHISLGMPYRNLNLCGQILRMTDGKYELIETVA